MGWNVTVVVVISPSDGAADPSPKGTIPSPGSAFPLGDEQGDIRHE